MLAERNCIILNPKRAWILCYQLCIFGVLQVRSFVCDRLPRFMQNATSPIVFSPLFSWKRGKRWVQVFFARAKQNAALESTCLKIVNASVMQDNLYMGCKVFVGQLFYRYCCWCFLICWFSYIYSLWISILSLDFKYMYNDFFKVWTDMI